MKKIVPFNNTLEFKTDVKEITSISLEHEITKSKDLISGVFYITGDYKISEAVFEKEQFNFELPFDIALSNSYKMDTLLVDIDDFRYSLVADKKLKVNIDLYIDGELEVTESLEVPEPRYINEESLEFANREDPIIEESLLVEENKEPERLELLHEMLTDNKEENMEENNINVNNNIFNNNKEENYVTYRVYVVEENDSVDNIVTKYKITKELLEEYNNLENIKCGDKLIIPTNER